jgi:hypothetical protein
LNADDYIQNNLVELHIYVTSHTIEYVVEQPEYELTALVSDLGGVIKGGCGCEVPTESVSRNQIAVMQRITRMDYLRVDYIFLIFYCVPNL